MTFGLCVVTLNAGSFIERWVKALAAQTAQPSNVLVIDSMSDDATVEIARRAGLTVKQIARKEFGHGRTRQLALDSLTGDDIVVFMTQDAILASSESLQKLVAAFDDGTVDVAYGRQLPHPTAGPMARHAREHNYPPTSEVRSLTGERPGIQVAFCSDSFAAYRASALRENGGFPTHVMFGEDMYVAAKCLLRGGRVAYVADATVYHSHDYSVYQDFRRYFDVGVFHKQEHWLLDALGRPEGRGAKFTKSEFSYLARHAPALIPEASLRLVARYAGYRMGLLERFLPRKLKRKISMCGHFKDSAREDHRVPHPQSDQSGTRRRA
jgi:rhamnosyltransferase